MSGRVPVEKGGEERKDKKKTSPEGVVGWQEE